MTPELPDHGAARSSDPETSHEAAAVVDVGILYGKILDALQIRPMTSEEISIHIEYPRDSVSPRMRAMAAHGLVVDTGTTRPNPTSSRHAIVWRIATEDDKQTQLPLRLAAVYSTKQLAKAMAAMLSSDDQHISVLAQRFYDAAK